MLTIPPHQARWGLLLTTLVMALALVGTGLSSFVGARQAARELLGARALDLAVLVRHSLRFAAQSDDTLGELLEEAQGRGLRGVAIVAPGERPWAAAGIDDDSAAAAAATCATPPGRPALFERDGAVLMAQPLRLGRGRGRGLGRGSGWMGGRGRRHEGPPPVRACLVLALDPSATTAVASRAGVTLLLAGFASALLLGVALVFWRASLRAEQLGAELARDRQLKMLGEMSAVLGHELRNPLASLKGHAQLLLEKVSPEHAARHGAERVVREVKRLEALTIEVLEYARTAELDLAPADPMGLARSSVEALAETRIDVVAESPPARCRVDAHRLQQVLENLLRNAVQASPDNGRVTLRVAGEPGRVVFEVRDQGPGITPGEEERIFEPFVTGQVRGTGLGLAVAKRIVDGHSGTITARNHPEGGALLRIELPVACEGGER